MERTQIGKRGGGGRTLWEVRLKIDGLRLPSGFPEMKRVFTEGGARPDIARSNGCAKTAKQVSHRFRIPDGTEHCLNSGANKGREKIAEVHAEDETFISVRSGERHD